MKLSELRQALLIVEDLYGDINTYINTVHGSFDEPIKLMKKHITTIVLSERAGDPCDEVVCHIREN